MNIFCTGISGINKKKFWNDFNEYAEKKGKSLEVYDVGDLIFKNAEELNIYLNQKNVLNTAKDTLTALRGNAFKDIKRMYGRKKNTTKVINTHASFLWGHVYETAFDAKYIKQLNIDLFITLIDNEDNLEKILSKSAQWSEENKLSKTDILYWQNIEVNDTDMLSQFKEKKHYIFPKSQPVEDIYKLIYVPNSEVVYVSYPMTDMDSEGRKKIDEFVEEIRRYFVVIDPKSIELSHDYSIVAGAQTVKRDLHWYVDRVSKVFAYFPKIVYSSGANAEMSHGKYTNKDVYLIYPSTNLSPFTSYISTYKPFLTKELLFEKLHEEGYKPLEF